MRPIILAAIAGLGLAAGLVAPADAATRVKTQKAAPTPVGKTCPTAWYYYKGKCIPHGRSWYGTPSYLYHYGPGIRYIRPHGGGHR